MAETTGVFSANRENSYYFKPDEDNEAGKKYCISEGIKTVTASPTETVTDDEYYDGPESDVVARKEKFDFSGDRKKGNEGQDMIVSLVPKTGKGRRGTFYWKDADGDVLEAPGTITDIVYGGGDAAGKGAFSFSVRCNGPLVVSEETI